MIDKQEIEELLPSITSLLEGKQHWLAALANISAFIYEALRDVSWVGVYVYDGSALQLGPFQGKMACTTLPAGKGVCFQAVESKELVIVNDVLSYEGHIACDSESRSELVIPIFYHGTIWGVFDIDSASLDRFKNEKTIIWKKIGFLLSQMVEKSKGTFPNELKGVAKAIHERRSVRKYRNQTIPNDIIENIIKNASLAPSGNNLQPWRFLVITSQEKKEQLAKVCHNQQWMADASAIIIGIADPSLRDEKLKGSDYHEEAPSFELKRSIRDTSVALEHIALEAVERGLGTCWIAWFQQKAIKAELGLQPHHFVVSVLTLGYPEEYPLPRPRRDLDTILYWEGDSLP